MSEVAALFVRSDSYYKTLGADCYDIERDALSWPGGCPAVFHPPCRSWGQLSHFSKPRPGESDLSLWAVRKCRQFGGVVEHPINSRLWAAVGCSRYGIRDDFGGVLIPVMQSWWGHRAKKSTGLYIVGPVPDLSPDLVDQSVTTVERMCKAEREKTPFQFAVFLLELAKSCGVGHA